MTAIQRQTLWAFFLSGVFTFIFTLFIPLLVEKGLSTSTASLALSLGFALSALIIPILGQTLDFGKFSTVGIISLFALCIGVFPFIITNRLPVWVVFICASFYVFGHSATSMASKRVSEALSQKEHLARSASITHMVESAALGCACILSYFLIKKFQTALIGADIASSIFLVFFLWLTFSKTKRLELLVNSFTKKKNKIGFRFAYKNKLLSIAIYLPFVTAACHQSAIPILLVKNTVNSKEKVALMLLTNMLTVILFSYLNSKGRLGKPSIKQYIFAMIFISAGHLGVPFVSSDSEIVITTVIWSIGEALFYPLFAFLVLGNFKSDESGGASATKSFYLQTTLALSPIIAAAITSFNNIAFSVFYGLCPLLGAVIVCKFRTHFNFQESS